MTNGRNRSIYFFAALLTLAGAAFYSSSLLPARTDPAVPETFIDYFRPTPMIGKLSTTVWGASAVGPRDPENGLEDQTMTRWNYWDGKILAIDLEGTEICDWLTSRGITAVLLKYRVPDSGPHYEPRLNRGVLPKAPTALEDAQRTVGLVRYHARQWHINPDKIGVIGFSAGGHLVADISTHFSKRSYAARDAADKVSCRPDFAIACYPGHLWVDDTALKLNPDIASGISKQTPPTFLVQAEDDQVDGVNQSLVYYVALKDAGVPVELHLYAHGGHAFGLRRTKFPITQWPYLVETWLRTIGMIPQ
jgi:acetyl esterase/lipase